MKRNEYKLPLVDVIEIENQDIVLDTSGTLNGNYNGTEDDDKGLLH